MKLREYEAKNVLREYGIPVPAGFLLTSAGDLALHLVELGDAFVLKAQVDVGGRGKAGGILMADKKTGTAIAEELFKKEIKGAAREGDPCRTAACDPTRILSLDHNRSFDKTAADPLHGSRGVEIEVTAREHPELIRNVIANPLMRDLPPFMLRELLGTAPKEIGPVDQQTLPGIP